LTEKFSQRLWRFYLQILVKPYNLDLNFEPVTLKIIVWFLFNPQFAIGMAHFFMDDTLLFYEMCDCKT